jgi:hypothetical protein
MAPGQTGAGRVCRFVCLSVFLPCADRQTRTTRPTRSRRAHVSTTHSPAGLSDIAVLENGHSKTDPCEPRGAPHSIKRRYACLIAFVCVDSMLRDDPASEDWGRRVGATHRHKARGIGGLHPPYGGVPGKPFSGPPRGREGSRQGRVSIPAWDKPTDHSPPNGKVEIAMTNVTERTQQVISSSQVSCP